MSGPFFSLVPPGSQFIEPYKLGTNTRPVQSPLLFLEWYSPGPPEDSMAESQDMRTRRHHREVHLFMSTLSPMRSLRVTIKPLSFFPHKEDALYLPFASFNITEAFLLNHAPRSLSGSLVGKESLVRKLRCSIIPGFFSFQQLNMALASSGMRS